MIMQISSKRREALKGGGGGGIGGGTEENLSFFLSSRDSHESRISWLVLLEDVFPILGKWGNLSSDVLVCEYRFARPIKRACSQASHVFERRTEVYFLHSWAVILEKFLGKSSL